MKWTVEEDNILVINYETLSKEELLKLLPNRSWDSILTRGKVTFKLSRKSFTGFKKGNILRKGVIPWNKNKSFLQMRGENNPNYNGYEYITDRGYKYIRTKDNTNNGNSYRPEHLVIIEKEIGRSIIRTKNGQGEGVHYIDGNKLNNEIDNLLLYSNEKEHRAFHNNLQELAFNLVQKGIIKFNKKNKIYYYEE